MLHIAKHKYMQKIHFKTEFNHKSVCTNQHIVCVWYKNCMKLDNLLNEKFKKIKLTQRHKNLVLHIDCRANDISHKCVGLFKRLSYTIFFLTILLRELYYTYMY